ncbi:MAG TPA: AlkA N-terminal domain-containing protein, partial [Bryobacteraceae bacterium]|nr:AlkA N-terminal domain-containing protein [Bryobacteraceae bacterium]
VWHHRAMEPLDVQACYRALQTRDSRFDGRLFVGVTSTGIYCRPICPARTPKFENCRFFTSAMAAQTAGFRPCLRCRPETAPDLASWRGTSNSVSRALALIAEGALENAAVDLLAGRLGIGGRQLRRLFKQHLGTTPKAVAQIRRVLFAKQLIQETELSMADVALASGFGSVRRFNETFCNLFQRPPSALRSKRSPALPDGSTAHPAVTLRLRYRPPYDWCSMLAYLKARAIGGVEWTDDNCYWRTISQDGQVGTVQVAHLAADNSLAATVHFPSVKVLPGIVACVRRVFDIGADVETIGMHLSRDSLLAPLVAQRPGLRLPGGWDSFELAVRAILGQQVTVEAGRQLATKLVALCSSPIPIDRVNLPVLTATFPTAAELLAADLKTLGMPSTRKAALKALAAAVISDPEFFQTYSTVEDVVTRLRTIPGIGDWTAQYIALRALRDTDAFPATDVGLLRGVALMDGGRPATAYLLTRAEPWRPWRAYAAQHLWAADALSAETLRGAHA